MFQSQKQKKNYNVTTLYKQSCDNYVFVVSLIMIKTLTKHGNSFALVIDRAILEILHIGQKTPLKISTDGKSLVVRPATPDEIRVGFGEALNEMNTRYGKMLKNLAN